MANERNHTPLEIEIPVPWSDRPMVVKISFWLAVVLAILIMAFAAANIWEWGISDNPLPVTSLDEAAHRSA